MQSVTKNALNFITPRLALSTYEFKQANRQQERADERKRHTSLWHTPPAVLA